MHICEYKKYTNEYGVSYNRPTGMMQPVVNIARYVKDSPDAKVEISHGIGTFVKVGNPIAKKMLSNLQKLTAGLTDEWIISHYNTKTEKQTLLESILE